MTPLTITRLTLSQRFSLSDSVVLNTLLFGRVYTDLCPDTVETVVSEFDELRKERALNIFSKRTTSVKIFSNR